VITGIHISPTDLIIKKETLQNNVLSSLKKGQKTDITILKLLPDNKAQVLLAGKKIIIKTPFPLTRGEKLQVNILRSEGRSDFKLLSSENNRVSEKLLPLIKLVSKSNPFAAISRTNSREVMAMLDSIALKSENTDKHFLSSLIKKSGMVFEKKVSSLLDKKSDLPFKQELLNIIKNDIKGYAISRLQSERGMDQREIKFYSDYSNKLENIQTLNARFQDSGKYLIPFPVLTNGVFETGQLFIDLGDKNRKDAGKNRSKIIKISFLLNMSNIGGLRADFSIYKKAISGVFHLADQKICDYVSENLDVLKKSLAGIDYAVSSIECKPAFKDDINMSSFIESFVKDETSLLNIVI